MSIFSEYLTNCVNQHVELTRQSKNELIGACQVNRSTFFQCLRGDRLPTKELLQRLLILLEIPTAVKRELKRLFYVEQIGWDSYRNHQLVASSLEAFTAFSQMPMPQPRSELPLPEGLTGKATIYGSENVVRAECELVQRELYLAEPHIDLFLPPSSKAFFDRLKTMYRQCGDKTIFLRQLVEFPKDKEKKERESIELLRFISFFLLSGCRGYEAYYYYADTNYPKTLGILYPYSIVTSGGTLFINEALNACLLTRLPHIQKMCRDQFQDNIGRARPFFTAGSGYEQMAELLSGSGGERLQVFHYSELPSVGGYLSGACMGRLSKKYCPRGKQNRVLRFYKDLQKKTNWTSFCTRRGILSFARTGILAGMGKRPDRPLEPEDRKEVLNGLLRWASSKGGIYLVDEEKLPISDQFAVTVVDGQCLQLRNRSGYGVREFQFPEQNLVKCFIDFLRRITSEPFPAERKELEEILRKAIALCERE